MKPPLSGKVTVKPLIHTKLQCTTAVTIGQFFHKSILLIALLHVARFKPARQRYLASQMSNAMY